MKATNQKPTEREDRINEENQRVVDRQNALEKAREEFANDKAGEIGLIDRLLITDPSSWKQGKKLSEKFFYPNNCFVFHEEV